MATTKTPDLRRINITPLGAPGVESNYLDWAFAVEVYLEASGLEYLLTLVDVKDWPSTWEVDTKTVIALLVQLVSEPNYQCIRQLKGDSRGMWLALKKAHQDHTSGGRIHWLYKLLLSRMEFGDDIPTHIKKMRSIYEHYCSLISVEQPLNPDDIFSAALIISLPPDHLPVVRPLLSNPNTTSEHVIHALTQDDTFLRTRLEVGSTEVSAAKAKSNNGRNPNSRQGDRREKDKQPSAAFDSSLH